MPMKSDPRMTDIQTMVLAAFSDSGERKALTPLEITSIPVTAAHPAAKERRIRKRERFSRSPPAGLGRGSIATPSVKDRNVPINTISPKAPIAKYVGIAKNRSEERRVGKECRARWSPDH